MNEYPVMKALEELIGNGMIPLPETYAEGKTLIVGEDVRDRYRAELNEMVGTNVEEGALHFYGHAVVAGEEHAPPGRPILDLRHRLEESVR